MHPCGFCAPFPKYKILATRLTVVHYQWLKAKPPRRRRISKCIKTGIERNELYVQTIFTFADKILQTTFAANEIYRHILAIHIRVSQRNQWPVSRVAAVTFLLIIISSQDPIRTAAKFDILAFSSTCCIELYRQLCERGHRPAYIA